MTKAQKHPVGIPRGIFRVSGLIPRAGGEGEGAAVVVVLGAGVEVTDSRMPKVTSPPPAYRGSSPFHLSMASCRWVASVMLSLMMRLASAFAWA